MTRKTTVAILSLSTLVLLAGGYVAADIYDVAPGILTMKEVTSPSPVPVISRKVADLPQFAPKVSPNPVTAEQIHTGWAALEATEATGNWNAWAIVADADTGEVIANYGGDTAVRPASVTKVLTAFTALNHMDGNKQLATSTHLAGQDLYLHGEGDLLLSANAGNPREVNGRAGLKDLAEATVKVLKESGTLQVTVHGTPYPFVGPAHLDKWDVTDRGGYEGRVGAYAIDSGKIGGVGSNHSLHPQDDVLRTFVEHLKASGIDTHIGKEAPRPASAQEVAKVSSATVAEQVRYMLQTSDNSVADQYCRLAAQDAGVEASYAGGTGLIRQTLQKAGVAVDGIALDDCSGLSADDRLTGLSLVQALHASMNSTDPDMAALLRSLPLSGGFGSLHSRLVDSDTIAKVQAKTGTLNDVSSLAGAVETRSGKILLFAVGTDNVPGQAGAANRPLLDGFVAHLARIP